MKNKIITSALLAAVFSFSFDLSAQELFRADFESYETTPYVFRFGNNVTTYSNYNYKPRWMYSHEVVENPVASDVNNSANVLRYTSMEARDYGLKVLFDDPIDIDELKTVQLDIYQPANVIGKDTYDFEDAATQQKIAIKLLAKFNTVNDFKQDAGIVLTRATHEFTTEGEWVTYSFKFSKGAYSSQTSQFTNGEILGIAILPTYGSGVTLMEDDQYLCYIDNIVVNPTATGIHQADAEATTIGYRDGALRISGAEEGTADITVYDLNGRILQQSAVTVAGGEATLPLSLEKSGIYLVDVTTANHNYRQKISNL